MDVMVLADEVRWRKCSGMSSDIRDEIIETSGTMELFIGTRNHVHNTNSNTILSTNEFMAGAKNRGVPLHQ